MCRGFVQANLPHERLKTADVETGVPEIVTCGKEAFGSFAVGLFGEAGNNVRFCSVALDVAEVTRGTARRNANDHIVVTSDLCCDVQNVAVGSDIVNDMIGWRTYQNAIG